MGLDGEAVQVGQTLVDVDVAEIAIEIGKTDGCAIVNRPELRKRLDGVNFERRWRAGFRCRAFGRPAYTRMDAKECSAKLLCGERTTVEEALPEVAALAGEKVRLGLVFDALGNRL